MASFNNAQRTKWKQNKIIPHNNTKQHSITLPEIRTRLTSPALTHQTCDPPTAWSWCPVCTLYSTTNSTASAIGNNVHEFQYETAKHKANIVTEKINSSEGTHAEFTINLQNATLKYLTIFPNITVRFFERYLPFLSLTSLTFEFLPDSRHETGCKRINKLNDTQWRAITQHKYQFHNIDRLLVLCDIRLVIYSNTRVSNR